MAKLEHTIKKAEKKFPYTILTPGGKKEKTDKNIQETAIREIREETGIEIKEDELIEIGSTNTFKQIDHWSYYSCKATKELPF